jgi:hypothetical protein
MSNLHFIKEPLSDSKLIYNEKTKRYELTINEVKENFTIPYNDDGILEQRIRKNSRVVYGYIYAMGNPLNRKIVDWLLHYTEEGREYLYDALISQIESDLASGFNSLAEQPRVNLKTGHIIPEEEMVLSMVSTPTRMILENSESYTNLNLLYRAKYDWLVFSQYKRWKNG